MLLLLHLLQRSRCDILQAGGRQTARKLSFIYSLFCYRPSTEPEDWKLIALALYAFL